MALQRLRRLLSQRPDRRGLLVAALAVAAAAALSVLLGAFIEPGAPAVFLAAVVVSAWYGGLWPGLLATGLAALVGEVFFFPPLYGLSSSAGVRVVSFVVVATLVASLYEAARQAQARAERALHQEQAARAEAEQASRTKDQFLATLSHELRTPLNALVGWVWWLKRGDLDRAQVERAVETLDRNARALAQLIEDLLDVSRITTGKLRLHVRPVDLPAVIEAAIDAVRPAAAAKDITILVQLDRAAAPSVAGDPDRLQQVLWNLLSNAIKFTPDKGQVSVRLEPAGDHVRVAVSDTGKGIAADLLPHVFDRFRQGDTPAAGQGLGLGLAIARHLVELHGGTIEAASEGPGRGATFTVLLPAGGAVAGPARPALAPAPGPAPAPLDGRRILVVAADTADGEWLTRTLSDAGGAVTTAASMHAALEVLQRDAPAVLVVDLRLSGEDGYELIRRVRPRRRPGARSRPWPSPATAASRTGRARWRRAISAACRSPSTRRTWSRSSARWRGPPRRTRPPALAAVLRRSGPRLRPRGPAAPAGLLRGRLE